MACENSYHVYCILFFRPCVSDPGHLGMMMWSLGSSVSNDLFASWQLYEASFSALSSCSSLGSVQVMTVCGYETGYHFLTMMCCINKPLWCWQSVHCMCCVHSLVWILKLATCVMEDAGGVLKKIWLMVLARCTSFFSLCSVPSFMTEWYWKRLMEGTPQFVEFHNRVYGCSGVMPDKFPCTGPNFTWAMNSLYIFILPSLLFLQCVALRPLAIHKPGVHGLLLSNPKFECGWTTGVRTGWCVARLVKDNKRP